MCQQLLENFSDRTLNLPMHTVTSYRRKGSLFSVCAWAQKARPGADPAVAWAAANAPFIPLAEPDGCWAGHLHDLYKIVLNIAVVWIDGTWYRLSRSVIRNCWAKTHILDGTRPNTVFRYQVDGVIVETIGDFSFSVYLQYVFNAVYNTSACIPAPIDSEYSERTKQNSAQLPISQIHEPHSTSIEVTLMGCTNFTRDSLLDWLMFADSNHAR